MKVFLLKCALTIPALIVGVWNIIHLILVPVIDIWKEPTVPPVAPEVMQEDFDVRS